VAFVLLPNVKNVRVIPTVRLHLDLLNLTVRESLLQRESVELIPAACFVHPAVNARENVAFVMLENVKNVSVIPTVRLHLDLLNLIVRESLLQEESVELILAACSVHPVANARGNVGNAVHLNVKKVVVDVSPDLARWSYKEEYGNQWSH